MRMQEPGFLCHRKISEIAENINSGQKGWSCWELKKHNILLLQGLLQENREENSACDLSSAQQDNCPLWGAKFFPLTLGPWAWSLWFVLIFHLRVCIPQCKSASSVRPWSAKAIKDLSCLWNKGSILHDVPDEWLYLTVSIFWFHTEPHFELHLSR